MRRPRGPSATTVGEEVLDHRRPARALERRRLLRPRPVGAGEDLQQDRRVGARLRVRLEALAHPAARRRGDGRGPAVGGDDRRRGARRLRLPRQDARHRAHRRHPRHRDGGRAALPHDAAHLVPGVPPRCCSRRRSSSTCPRPCATRSSSRWREVGRAEAARRSPKTRCRASCRTSSPAGWRTCSTCAGRTSPPTRPARRPSPRSTRRSRCSCAGHCDAVITGGVDRNMGTNSFVKFCKIGALSATGTRPFGDGADGFVMGEGSAAFLLKRLADAERDGDRVYAVVRGVGGSSRRQGQGHHRAEPDRPAAGDRARVGERGARPGHVRPRRGPRHEHQGRRRGRGREPGRRSSRPRRRARSPSARPRATSATSRPAPAPPGCSRRSGPSTRSACRRRSTRARRTPRSTSPRSPFFLEPRAARVEADGRRAAPLRRLRLRLRRDELPRRARGARAGRAHEGPPAGAGRGARGVRRDGSPRHGPDRGRPPLRGLAVIGADSVDALRGRVEALLARAREGHLPPAAPPLPRTSPPRERIALDYEGAGELRRPPAEGPEGPRDRRAGDVEARSRRRASSAAAERSAGQDRVPLHGPGQPVREHGPRPRGRRRRSWPPSSRRPTASSSRSSAAS